MDEPKEAILVAQSKWLHKMLLSGHVHSGGGTIPLEFGYALKFVCNKEFAQINLIQVGKGKEIPSQRWQKAAKVTTTKPKKKPTAQIELQEAEEY